MFSKLFSCVHDGLGSRNKSTTGKPLWQRLGSIEILVPTLTENLGGSQHTRAFISSYTIPAAVAMLGMIVLQGADASKKLGKIHNTHDAQTARVSNEMFAEDVSYYLLQRIDETRNKARGAHHWFFVYHPDTKWHPNFVRLWDPSGENKRLIGISNSLPQLCCFMMHIRTYLGRIGDCRRIAFHLLMPAYRYMYINEKLAFNPGLYPLVLEGHIYYSHPFVMLRVVNEEQRNAFKMRDIKNQPDDEPGFWNLWKIFTPETLPLDLGNDGTESNSGESDAYYDSDSTKNGLSLGHSKSTSPSPTSARGRNNKVVVTQYSPQNTRTSSGRSAWVRRQRPHSGTRS